MKQILRSVDENFDERRYGFTGIVEALRYCQREGLFRLDRDRQGVLRVYPGPVLQRASTAAPQQAIDTDATPAGVAAAPLEDDDNRGNRIESGDRFDRGGRGDRRDRGRGDREERGARGDRGDRGERGDRGDRTRREDRAEYGEPLAPGTLELFPLTEASSDNETGAGAAASSGDGAHGPIDGRHDRGITGRSGRRGRECGRSPATLTPPASDDAHRRRQAQANRARRPHGQEDGEAVVEVRQAGSRG